MPPDSVDLTNCDREPIHVPGGIQPHGCLLACEGALDRVIRHSANTRAFLGLDRDEINGATLSEIIGPDLTHELRNALAISPEPKRPGLLFDAALSEGGPRFHVAAHRYNGVALVEFERAAQGGAVAPVQIARALTSRLSSAESVEDMVTLTPRLVRGVLGYDRVMVYKFAEDGAGKVVSESKRGDLESFLGQHFPASDIPKQARELYLRNTIRIIASASGDRSEIVPELNDVGAPLDLSFSHLRSVSPIHTEYLRNMGVGASMSISIIVGGELWGLIACHHYAPKALTLPERVAAEMFGEFFSLQLETIQQRQVLAASLEARRVLDGLMRDLAVQTDVGAFLGANAASFAKLLPCDGVGVWLKGVWSGHGVTPPREAIPALAMLLDSAEENRVWATSELWRHLPEAEAFAAQAAGVLAIPLSQLAGDYVLLFRKEQLETVEWAGDPNKTYESGPMGDRLTPRKSFAIWKQTVRNRSASWADRDLEIAEAARTTLLEVILRHTEMLSDERRKADVRQKVLNEELNHRVKNILALIKSLISQPVEERRSLSDYVSALKGRIMALSFAHDQVARGDQGGPLRDLLAAELSPYEGGDCRVVLDGPDLALDARAYSVLALVIHELATNAAKYGALSVPTGVLTVTWELNSEGPCTVSWSESGVAGVKPPEREGFGSVLLHRSIPYDLGGESAVTYEPDGVRATLSIPRRFVSQYAPDRSALAGSSAVRSQPASLQGRHLLLVEDQLVIAMDAEQMLAEKGATRIETAATVEDALSRIEACQPEAAVLDINLGVVTSMPVAEELRRRGVPFVFASGYGDSAMIPEQFAHVPVVRKPFEAEKLATAVGEALAALTG